MNKQINMFQYWTSQNHYHLSRAKTFADLLPIALDVITRMPDPIVMVSGPITTGGKGSIEKNLQYFSTAIQSLADAGENVFDQTPFHDVMQTLTEPFQKQSRYPQQLLDEFYLPILQSGEINTIYFLPGWETSRGARWEYDQCQKNGIMIKFYTENL